jgi:hypothetical protein
MSMAVASFATSIFCGPCSASVMASADLADASAAARP